MPPFFAVASPAIAPNETRMDLPTLPQQQHRRSAISPASTIVDYSNKPSPNPNSSTMTSKSGKPKTDTFASAIVTTDVAQRPPPTVRTVVATTVRPSCTSLSPNKRVTRIRQYMLLGQCVGKGNFARVELTEHTTLGCRVALKIIDTSKVKEDYVLQNLEREARMLMRLSHPNIVSLFETFRADRFYILALEFVNGKDLVHYIKCQPKRTVPEELARKLFGQLVSAVKHMHELNVVHRDLKLENILLDESENFIKVVDFGLSNEWSAQKPLLTNCGSPEYAAPELYRKGHPYGPEIDVWSLGIILYGMIVGSLPFSIGQGNKYVGENKENLRHQIANGLSAQHKAKLHTSCSKPLRDIIQQLICVDAKNRITVAGIVAHQWMRAAAVCGSSAVPQYANIFPHPVDEKVLIINRLADVLRMPAHMILEQVKQANSGGGGGEVLSSAGDSLKTLFRILLLDNRKQILLGNASAPHRGADEGSKTDKNANSGQLEVYGTPTMRQNQQAIISSPPQPNPDKSALWQQTLKNTSFVTDEANGANQMRSLSAQANSFSDLIFDEEKDRKLLDQSDEHYDGFFGIQRPTALPLKPAASTTGPFRRKMERMFSVAQPSSTTLAHPSQQQTHALESHTALAHINHTHMTNYNSVLPAASSPLVRLRATRSATAAATHGGGNAVAYLPGSVAPPPVSAAQVLIGSKPIDAAQPQLFSTLFHHDRQQKLFQQQVQRYTDEAKHILDQNGLGMSNASSKPTTERHNNYRNAPQPWRRKYAVNRIQALSAEEEFDADNESKMEQEKCVVPAAPQQRPFSTSILSSTARQLRQQKPAGTVPHAANVGTRLHTAHTVASRTKLASAVEQHLQQLQQQQQHLVSSPARDRQKSPRPVSSVGGNLRTMSAAIASPTFSLSAQQQQPAYRLARSMPHKGANYAQNGVAYMAFRSPLFAKTSLYPQPDANVPQKEQQQQQQQMSADELAEQQGDEPNIALTKFDAVLASTIDQQTNMELQTDADAVPPQSGEKLIVANETPFPPPTQTQQPRVEPAYKNTQHWKVDQTLHALHQVPHPYVDLTANQAVLNKPMLNNDETYDEKASPIPPDVVLDTERARNNNKRALPPMSRTHMQAIHNANAKLRREFFYEGQEVKFLQDLVPSADEQDDDDDLVLMGRGDGKSSRLPSVAASTVPTFRRPSKILNQRLDVSPRFGASIAVNTHPSIRFADFFNGQQRASKIIDNRNNKSDAASSVRHKKLAHSRKRSDTSDMGTKLGIPPLVYAEMLQARNTLSRSQTPYNTLQIHAAQQQQRTKSPSAELLQYEGLAGREKLPSPVPVDGIIKFRNRIQSLR